MAKSFGNIKISSKDLPEIKDWKVNETYEVEVYLKLTGIRKATVWDSNEMIETNEKPKNPPPSEVVADFDIVGIEVEPDEPEDTSLANFREEFTKVRTGQKILGKKKSY